MLRDLDASIDGMYRILLADSACVALRGLDFRSYDNAILFATMRSFVHEREYIQAANRVGRGADRCRRVIFGDTALVDHLASCSYKRKLVQFLDSVQAKSLIKMKKMISRHKVEFLPVQGKRKQPDQA